MTTTITQRTFTTAFAAAAFPARADTAALQEAARKEASLTWYVAQVDSETAEPSVHAAVPRDQGVGGDRTMTRHLYIVCIAA